MAVGGAIGGHGCDVLVQLEEGGTCQGFRDIAAPRPVRILVRTGTPGAAESARLLAEALSATLGSLGAEAGLMPCGAALRRECIAQEEPQTRNLLVWVGSGGTPDASEESVVRAWLDEQANPAAVAVVPQGLNPDLVVPQHLRNRQVVWWDGSPDRAALDVIVAAGIDTAERRIFVSYSHADGIDLAHAVFHALSEARFSVFLDAFALAPGSDFAERIEHELLDKAFLVLIETPEALESDWIERELSFARRHRLGIASVWPGGVPRLESIGHGRRWQLPAGGLHRSGPGGPVLDRSAADDLRDFVVPLHAAAILRRREVLDEGLRAALHRVGVPRGNVTGLPGGLRVDAGGSRWDVSLRPRPASLIDMHEASCRTLPGHRAVMVSATPHGRPEGDALGWLARESGIPHQDEGRLLSLAAGLARGKV